MNIDTLLNSPRIKRDAYKAGVQPIDYALAAAQANGPRWFDTVERQIDREQQQLDKLLAESRHRAEALKNLPPGCSCRNGDPYDCECASGEHLQYIPYEESRRREREEAKREPFDHKAFVAKVRDIKARKERARVVDAILAESQLRKPIFDADTMEHFARRMRSDLRNFNRLHFFGRVPADVRLSIDRLPDDTLGQWQTDRVGYGGRHEIRINSGLFSARYDADDHERYAIAKGVLLHEAVHAYLHAVNAADVDHHGERFFQATQRIGPRVSREQAAYWPHIANKKHMAIIDGANHV